MVGKKVQIKNFGCQMNKLDSELVSCALQEAGLHLTGSVKEADVVVINTCSVRQRAEQKVFSHLGHLKHIKQSRPGIVVAVIGCMAQRLGGRLLEHEAVDIVCGPGQIAQVCGLIRKAMQENEKSVAVTEKIRQVPTENKALEDFESAYGTDKGKLPCQGFVRVMRGCDNFCTYCVVPYVRGPEISRPPKAIIEQISKLAGNGVKLVTLLGQTVNAYKYTNGAKTYCLADLLYMASEIEGIEWLRFVTSYPSEEFFNELLRAMADLPKVCRYLHMPAQSGSDRILQAMNRHYSAEQYLNLLARARDVVDDIAVSGDFIVGFPGESDEDFQATVELVKKARYKNCFIFKYSPRPGTTAEKRLEDNVCDEIKKQRNIELLAVQETISGQLSSRFQGKEVSVLVEGLSKKPHLNSTPGAGVPQLIGRTAEDWIVVFNGPPTLAGRFAKVKISDTSPLTLFGEYTRDLA